MIFLTVHADARLAAEALRAGAAGFVVKEAAGNELIAAIHQVLAGPDLPDAASRAGCPSAPGEAGDLR